MKEAHYMHK